MNSRYQTFIKQVDEHKTFYLQFMRFKKENLSIKFFVSGCLDLEMILNGYPLDDDDSWVFFGPCRCSPIGLNLREKGLLRVLGYFSNVWVLSHLNSAPLTKNLLFLVSNPHSFAYNLSNICLVRNFAKM